ncbi:MAG: Cys-tRNA(Pro) deacylase [Actinobacteria bacterium]|nr:Cys-tRNA(Pro) deacylase [Actinomycetota bacterium]
MSATPATRALDEAGVAYRLHPYDHDPANRHFGEEAAAALGVDQLRIFKTLIVDTGAGRPPLAVAVVPVAGQLDLKAMATALGVKKVELADPAAASRSSGYLIGGISPLGQKTPLPTVVDETAELFDTVYVSAGRRGLQLELAPADLASLTAARFADIAR